MTTTTASVLLDPSGMKISPIVVSARICQEESAHDMAVIRIRGIDPTSPIFSTGMPVQIMYGWNPTAVENFYGYVNHIEPEHNHSTQPSLASMYSNLVCIGASYGMRNATSAAWVNAQASSLVMNEVLNYRFSGMVETDDPVWPQLSNPGISDWKFVSGLAAKLGWTFSVNKTHLRFLSLEKIMQQDTNTMPTFWTRAASPDASLFSISSFHSLQGETAQVGANAKATRTTANVDRVLGSFTVSSSPPSPLLGSVSPDPIFEMFETNAPAVDMGVATNALAGIQRQNRFYIQAEAVVAGNPYVTQGIPVVLLGLGSSNNGVWYVHKADHLITSDNYVTKLSLGRDSTVDNGLRPVRPTTQERAISDANAFSAAVPPTVLVGQGWRAQYYSVQEV